MKSDSGAIGQIVPAHEEYWRKLALPDYMGGPFADRTGGMILFSAADLERAEVIARDDPFRIRGLLQDQYVKEWTVK